MFGRFGFGSKTPLIGFFAIDLGLNLTECFSGLTFFQIGVFKILPSFLFTRLDSRKVFIQLKLSNEECIKFFLQLPFLSAADDCPSSAGLSTHDESAIAFKDGSIIKKEPCLRLHAGQLFGRLKVCGRVG